MNTELRLKQLVEAAREKFVHELVGLRMTDLLCLTDWFLIGTVNSEAQMRAVANHFRALAKEKKLPLLHVEGETGLRWVLLDFGDVAVHLFQPDERKLYDLEGLWFQAEKVIFPDEEEAAK